MSGNFSTAQGFLQIQLNEVASAKLFTPPIDKRFEALLFICFCCVMYSSVMGIKLARANLVAGQKRTDCITPDAEAVDHMIFALSIPVFSFFSFMAVVLVELAPVWNLLQNLVVALNFAMIPKNFCSGMPGTLRMQHIVEKRGDTLDEIQMYGQTPCCCIKPCNPARKPDKYDFRKLKAGIWQISFFLPVCSLIQFVILEEMIMKADFAKIWQKHTSVLKWIQVFSQCFCMSCCVGLADLVASLTNHPDRKELFVNKKGYCSSFLTAMGLLPMVLSSAVHWFWSYTGGSELSNSQTMNKLEMANFTQSVCVCLGTLTVVSAAKKAFPTNQGELVEEESPKRGAINDSYHRLPRDDSKKEDGGCVIA